MMADSRPVNGQSMSKMNKLSSSIPVIDLKDCRFDPVTRSSVCARVTQACETVGFFQIINSGVPEEILDSAFDSSRRFYELSQKEKNKLAPNLGEKAPAFPVFRLGYKGFPISRGIKNNMERMVFRHYHMNPALQDEENSYSSGSPTTGDIDPKQNWWPSNPPEYKESIKKLLEELGKLADFLLDIFSESLGLPPTFLREEQHKNSTVPRHFSLHHYPRGTKPDEDETGTIPHRDSTIFTIVVQSGANGLEINPNEQWIPVVPERGALVVNVGETLQAWTNGRYRSILHRVQSNKETGRHSAVYFLFPAGPEADCIVGPIAKLLGPENPPLYAPFSYLDFLKDKQKVTDIAMLQKRKLKVAPGRI